MNIDAYMNTLGEHARVASRAISRADTATKNRALVFKFTYWLNI